MWLVADSGSTKTEWILFDSSGQVQSGITGGLNPLYLTEAEFIAELEIAIPVEWPSQITQIWFYGAGCGAIDVNKTAANWLHSFFAKAEVNVASDMLGAARATCGADVGLVAILGTGSNSCFYNGKEIEAQIKPLGFILGDEGSGAALGKSLLKKLLRDELPSRLSKNIYVEIGLNYHEIIRKIYKEEWPNRFIASCTKSLFLYKEEPEIAQIIAEEFDRFALLIKKYEANLPVNIIGSVGYYFQDFIALSLQNQGIGIGQTLKAPTKALVAYHIQHHH